jgi:NAD(P)-dependent dehydrogenase (short-subunit alcohol dehydrogenase family)
MSSSNMHLEIDLGAQVAIVTGGGRGIGRAMALALAKSGAAVAVVARSTDQLAQTVALVEGAGRRAIPITADVTDQQATEQMAREVEQQLGPVDLLVNNAGAPTSAGPLWETDPDEWWRCIDVNLRGPFLCSRAVLPGMVARRRGRIITTASGAGLGPWPYVAAYAIGKCAAIRFSENLAAETKEHGISVFSISPGFVRTGMVEAIAGSSEDEKWLGGFFRRSLAAGHDVPPERAANLVVLLASGQADSLSGCYIGVGDDVAEMVRRAEEIQQDELYTLRLRT